MFFFLWLNSCNKSLKKSREQQQKTTPLIRPQAVASKKGALYKYTKKSIKLCQIFIVVVQKKCLIFSLQSNEMIIEKQQNL